MIKPELFEAILNTIREIDSIRTFTAYFDWLEVEAHTTRMEVSPEQAVELIRVAAVAKVRINREPE